MIDTSQIRILDKLLEEGNFYLAEFIQVFDLCRSNAIKATKVTINMNLYPGDFYSPRFNHYN